MNDSRLFLTLITPSFSSFILSSISAVLAVLGANWAYLRSQPLFMIYFSGRYSLRSLFHELNMSLSTLFSSDLSYNIAVICFALLFGVSVYFMTASIRHIIAEAHATLDEVGYVADQHSREAMERSLLARVTLRCATTVVWLSYTILFFNGILPFCSSLVAGHGPMLSFSPIQTLLAFIILFATIHLHVVFVRFLVLRPRLFGIEDVVIGRGGH